MVLEKMIWGRLAMKRRLLKHGQLSPHNQSMSYHSNETEISCEKMGWRYYGPIPVCQRKGQETLEVAFSKEREETRILFGCVKLKIESVPWRNSMGQKLSNKELHVLVREVIEVTLNEEKN